LISKRPYKRAWSIQEALDYLQEQSGKLFDPRCVNALMRNRERLEQICERFVKPSAAMEQLP
jgi:two-component system, response regulator RpfG